MSSIILLTTSCELGYDIIQNENKAKCHCEMSCAINKSKFVEKSKIQAVKQFILCRHLKGISYILIKTNL